MGTSIRYGARAGATPPLRTRHRPCPCAPSLCSRVSSSTSWTRRSKHVVPREHVGHIFASFLLARCALWTDFLPHVGLNFCFQGVHFGQIFATFLFPRCVRTLEESRSKLCTLAAKKKEAKRGSKVHTLEAESKQEVCQK